MGPRPQRGASPGVNGPVWLDQLQGRRIGAWGNLWESTALALGGAHLKPTGVVSPPPLRPTAAEPTVAIK